MSNFKFELNLIRLIAIVQFSIALALPLAAFAQTPIDTSHKASLAPDTLICTSYNHEENSWGLIGAFAAALEEENCPANHALLTARNPGGKMPDGTKVPVKGNCCPLPPGTLTDQTSYQLLECPEGYIATGTKQDMDPSLPAFNSSYTPTQNQYLRCTKIDLSRFQLSEPTSGLYVGWYRQFSTFFSRRTTWSKIPLELRYGFGRTSRYSWDHTFCAALPWGSALVGKSGKYCSDFTFRQLQYRGLPGDPPNKSPAIPINKCLYFDNVFSSNPKCYAAKP